MFVRHHSDFARNRNSNAPPDSQFFNSVRAPPRARCLTLTLAPNGAGPGRLLRFAMLSASGPFATRARDGHATTLEHGCFNSPSLIARTVRRARVRHPGQFERVGLFNATVAVRNSAPPEGASFARPPAAACQPTQLGWHYGCTSAFGLPLRGGLSSM